MQLNKEEMLTLLHQEVVPALGCTEPVRGPLRRRRLPRHRRTGGVHQDGGQPRHLQERHERRHPRLPAGGPEVRRRPGCLPGQPGEGAEPLEEINSIVSKEAIRLVEDKQVSVTIAEGRVGSTPTPRSSPPGHRHQHHPGHPLQHHLHQRQQRGAL